MRPLNACKPAIIFATFWVSFGNLTKITTLLKKKKSKHGISRETANGKVDHKATFHLKYYSKVSGAD